MTNKIVIGLIGEKGSGKGTAAKYIMEKYGAAHYGASDILKKAMEAMHIETSRSNFITFILSLKKGFGEDVLMRALKEEVKKDEAPIVIADGIRMRGDTNPFKEEFGDNFYLFYVTADVKTRYERTKKRGEKAGEDKTTFEEFLAEEQAGTEAAIPEIGRGADFTFDNNGEQKNLQVQIEETMGKIIK